MASHSFNLTVRRGLGRTAFTLVELLTVVAIIILLIGILVPALNAVRNKAKVTASKAMIGTLSTGLDTFRADQSVGGTFVPSISDAQGDAANVGPRQVVSPYSNLTGGPSGAIDITGSGLLVWGLAGADLLGTPGFKTFRSETTYWADDTDATGTTVSDSGAYALDANQDPLHARVTPFVDLSKIEVTRWNENAQTADGAGSFEIEAETKACEALGTQQPKREYPMFVDAFGGPILYWRADPAGSKIADLPRRSLAARNRGIYHFLDNSPLLRANPGGGLQGRPLILRPTRRLEDTGHSILWKQTLPGGGGSTQEQAGFSLYIQNKNMQAKPVPHNADTYLLISAGPDGEFGTADDVANFEHNGAEDTGR